MRWGLALFGIAMLLGVLGCAPTDPRTKANSQMETGHVDTGGGGGGGSM